jgi:hypothetical protein
MDDCTVSAIVLPAAVGAEVSVGAAVGVAVGGEVLGEVLRDHTKTDPRQLHLF